MRNGHNGLKRFFIVCGAVCCLGLLMVVIGYFTGGMRGMNDMDQRYDWIKVGDAGMTSNHHAPYDLGYTRATMA